MNGSISESQLLQKLMNSKKIIEKLDGESTYSDEYDYDNYSYEDYSLPVNEHVEPTPAPIMEDRISKIQNSGLPDAVKRAMIESPIQQTTVEPQTNFNRDLLNSARRLMNEGKKKPVPQKQIKKPQGNISINPETLMRLISETVEKVLDSKLKQLNESQKSEIEKINETLVLKVGNNIFKGKITEVKQIK